MTTSAIITVLAIAALVLFVTWALLPTMTANRRRILRSPATWALVALALSWLCLQWEARREAREIAAMNDAISAREQIADRQIARARRAVADQAHAAMQDSTQHQPETQGDAR